MRFSAKIWVLLTGALALGLAGCTSHSASSGPVQASDTASGHIDVLCIGDRVNNPAEAFHDSYKYTGPPQAVNDEADITPQSIDATIADKSGKHSFHGSRGDSSWDRAVVDLARLNFTAMTARLVPLNDTSAIARQASESVNGYDTTRYAIDTSTANAKDRKMFAALFGDSTSEKGTVWMAGDDCAAKLVLDENLQQSDGAIATTHFEINRIKK